VAQISKAFSFGNVFFLGDLQEIVKSAERADEIMGDCGLNTEFIWSGNRDHVSGFKVEGTGEVQDVIQAYEELQEARIYSPKIVVPNEEEKIYVKYATREKIDPDVRSGS
jgi:hypothetical protein